MAGHINFFIKKDESIYRKGDGDIMQLNELIKIYKGVFSLTNGYKRMMKLHSAVRILIIIAGVLGAAVIIFSIFFPKYIWVPMIVFLIVCIIIVLVTQFILKRKYNDIYYLAKESNAEFFDEASRVLKLNLKEEKVLNAVVENLNFHWKKEENRVSFLTFFKPGVSWFAFILPVLLSFFIDKIDSNIIFLLILLSLYILAFIFIFQAVFVEINNNSKPNIIKSVLEILHEQKIINLRRNIALDEIKGISLSGDFNKLTWKVLIDAEYENLIEQNMAHYISAINSITGDVDANIIQGVINECNLNIGNNEMKE